MPMNNVIEGNAMAAAVAAVSIPTSSAITSSTLQQIWQGIAAANISELAKALVAPGAFLSPPGVTGGPILGIGGPVT